MGPKRKRAERGRRPEGACPCGSGTAYGGCCAPYHRGEEEAPTPEALMRSRYAAFALGMWGYLYDTLHPDHDDRAVDRDRFVEALARGQRGVRYLGLRVLETAGPDADGAATVRFAASVRSAGRDRSFVERSTFVNDGVGWRYLCGTLEPSSA